MRRYGFRSCGLTCLAAVTGVLGCAAVRSSGTDAGAGSGGPSVTPTLDGSPVDRSAAGLSPPDALITADVATGGGADATCATQSAMAETLPLDLYLMMDTSGSMLDLTAAGVTKWDAVRTAMTAFLNDPQSAGIGVGVQYFPQIQPNAPDLCTADGMCGAFGPCDRIRTCLGPRTTMVVSCAVNSDCPTGQTCTLLGFCPVEGILCAPLGSTCLLGDVCTDIGGNCRARDICDVAAYATPAVSIGVLPGAATGLIASLGAHQPDGLTPTGPALSGAIQYAQQRVTANPNRKLAVLLVTDGFPSECTPVDIPAVAAVAAAGAARTPPIPTFVIGVFGPDEAVLAPMNLNVLAQAGGTGSAVVINTNQNVTQVLQTALNQIRTTAVACEYKIPPPTVGAIDFGKVNVQFTSGSGAATTIGHVTGKATCDPTRGGWYYDVDPSTGQAPTSIVACDVTCSQFRASAAARVDIVLGCQTIVIL